MRLRGLVLILFLLVQEVLQVWWEMGPIGPRSEGPSGKMAWKLYIKPHIRLSDNSLLSVPHLRKIYCTFVRRIVHLKLTANFTPVLCT